LELLVVKRAISTTLLLIALQSCSRSSTQVFELPPGYRGWVHISVDMPDCPPLDSRKGVTFFRIDSAGKACTSGIPRVGRSRLIYVFGDQNRTHLKQTGWGGGGMIWGNHSIVFIESHGKRYACSFGFFVGAEEEFRASGDDSPVNETCSPREFDPKRASQ
jgi:hypothetical protein